MILIKAGTYVEQLLVKRDSITLVGEGQGITVIKCNRSQAGGFGISRSATLGERKVDLF